MQIVIMYIEEYSQIYFYGKEQACVMNECIKMGNFSNLGIGEDGDFQNIYHNFPLIGCLPISANTMAILL